MPTLKSIFKVYEYFCFVLITGSMGAKKSLTGEEVDPEMKEQQEAQQKLAEAEALANQQNGTRLFPNNYYFA